MLNLVCRDLVLKKSVLDRLRAVFPSILSRKIEEEVNEVLLCTCGEKKPSEAARILPALNQSAKDLQSTLSSTGTKTSRSPHIDIVDLLKDLKVE